MHSRTITAASHCSSRIRWTMPLRAFGAPSKLRPDDPDALYYLGCALLKKHEPAQAAHTLQHALRLNAGDAHARNALAVALAAMKDLSAARTQLQSARTLEPGNALYQRNLGCLDR